MIKRIFSRVHSILRHFLSRSVLQRPRLDPTPPSFRRAKEPLRTSANAPGSLLRLGSGSAVIPGALDRPRIDQINSGRWSDR